MTQRATTEAWVRGYERLWRTPGTDGLAELFTTDASYLPSPWATPVVGLPALAEFWESERSGPDESFTMTSEVIAVDGPTAVVRVSVEYGAPERSGEPGAFGSRWRDLWVLQFDEDGRCAAFEEWPFAPGQPDGHDQPTVPQ
ncbi:YybH family protein [Promicromonospora panici]|uniref:YybH family protein n=1 Tax=Promicromonospora panici TaxID=2219658 RepID=UPI00101C2FA9|nr:nuclear transport factor 2 family protein [Promicromonospora panici]